MSAATVSFQPSLLAWSPSAEDDARFRRILRIVLILAALLSLLMIFMPPPEVDRSKHARTAAAPGQAAART